VGDVPAPLQLFEPYNNETGIGEILLLLSISQV
jgi:hypothetical protein